MSVFLESNRVSAIYMCVVLLLLKHVYARFLSCVCVFLATAMYT